MAVAFGRYQLLKKIASGGMGQVFLARTAQAGFEKLVVIKRILPHLVEDEEFLTMFLDEARIAARLNHPNLAQIFDLGQVGGMHYLAMEYVQGDDLRRVEKQARKQQQPLPLGAICRIVADAAAGLDHAHKLKDAQGQPLNLIHRDVSPQNVLVGFDGGVKLIDFGVARAAGRAQHTATGILKGKYPYMSPEQIAGDAYDHRSDQFALAIVFWELLTGRRLFKGDSDLVTMRLVRECQVPVPSSLHPGLPRELDALVLKALSPRAGQRFADTGELRMAIEDFTVSARLPATPAHLAAYLRTLYAERIQREADLASLDELHDPSAFEEDSAPSKPSSSRAAAPAVPDAPAQEPEPRPTQAVTRPGVRRRRVPVSVVAGAAVAVIALAVGVPLALRRPEPSPAPTPEPQPARAVQLPVPPAPPPQPAAAPPEAKPKPARVLLQLESVPAGAEVRVAGQPVGVTPFQYPLEPGAEPVQALFTLAGHEPRTASLSVESGPVVSVSLKPLAHQEPARRRREAPALGIKTGR